MMLRALLASGAVLQAVKADASARLQRKITLVVCALIAMMMIFLALVAFGIAAAIALAPQTGAAWATAIVGGAALLIGLLVLLIGVQRGRAPERIVPARSPAETAAAAALGEMGLGRGGNPVPWMVGAVILGLLLGRRV